MCYVPTPQLVPEPLVVATNVQKSFRHMGRTLEVLRGVDLEIRDGEMLGIVGPSGAGKSTLLHCIGTLDVPTRGSIQLAGEEITAMPGWRLAELRNRTIGFVFQFHHLLPEFNALENVMMPGLVQGRRERELETPRARAARRGGARRAAPPPPGRALGRRAAARGPRAGAAARAEAPPGRRAHRQPRLGDERADPRPVLRHQQAARDDHRRRDPQPGARGRACRGWSPSRTGGSRRTSAATWTTARDAAAVEPAPRS